MKRRFFLVSPWCLEQTQRGEGVARVVTVGRVVARLRGLHPVRGSRSRTHETMRLLRDYETTRLGVTRRPGITIHWDLLHTSLGVLEISCVLVSSLFHVPVFHVLVYADFCPYGSYCCFCRLPGLRSSSTSHLDFDQKPTVTRLSDFSGLLELDGNYHGT